MEYLFSFDRIVNMKTFIEAVKNCEHEVFLNPEKAINLRFILHCASLFYIPFANILI